MLAALVHAAALSFVLRTPCTTPCSTPARVAARAMIAEPGAMKLKEIKAELDELGVAWKGARSCGTTNALGIKTKWQARFYDFEASVKNHKSKCATSKTASALPV